ncbi:hypothetical protein NADFUDRAFT_67542 [Nadsonia fulvescens var. elongata DSM 6958]|uniref:Ell binding protein Ebp1 C-terminal domain-containing protein n=1 Tax=Nadsonia fulvescens var. elongata DSM 6958 TaxID=857566 RepID=A0A1E3PEY8_9ASCO|nr:hypothetical protein NADFUDRAFT_67542 [Nadsonia fulvescens var. elongata DSM 6958]
MVHTLSSPRVIHTSSTDTLKPREEPINITGSTAASTPDIDSETKPSEVKSQSKREFIRLGNNKALNIVKKPLRSNTSSPSNQLFPSSKPTYPGYTTPSDTTVNLDSRIDQLRSQLIDSPQCDPFTHNYFSFIEPFHDIPDISLTEKTETLDYPKSTTKIIIKSEEQNKEHLKEVRIDRTKSQIASERDIPANFLSAISKPTKYTDPVLQRDQDKYKSAKADVAASKAEIELTIKKKNNLPSIKEKSKTQYSPLMKSSTSGGLKKRIASSSSGENILKPTLHPQPNAINSKGEQNVGGSGAFKKLFSPKLKSNLTPTTQKTKSSLKSNSSVSSATQSTGSVTSTAASTPVPVSPWESTERETSPTLKLPPMLSPTLPAYVAHLLNAEDFPLLNARSKKKSKNSTVNDDPTIAVKRKKTKSFTSTPTSTASSLSSTSSLSSSNKKKYDSSLPLSPKENHRTETNRNNNQLIPVMLSPTLPPRFVEESPADRKGLLKTKSPEWLDSDKDNQSGDIKGIKRSTAFGDKDINAGISRKEKEKTPSTYTAVSQNSKQKDLLKRKKTKMARRYFSSDSDGNEDVLGNDQETFLAASRPLIPLATKKPLKKTSTAPVSVMPVSSGKTTHESSEPTVKKIRPKSTNASPLPSSVAITNGILPSSAESIESKDSKQKLVESRMRSYIAIAREKKHEADTADRNNDYKRAAIITMDSLICYIIGFTFDDINQRLNKKIPNEKLWVTLVPYISRLVSYFDSTQCEVSRHLIALCYQIRSLIDTKIASNVNSQLKNLLSILSDSHTSSASVSSASSKTSADRNQALDDRRSAKLINLSGLLSRYHESALQDFYRGMRDSPAESIKQYFPKTWKGRSLIPIQQQPPNSVSFQPTFDSYYLPLGLVSSLPEAVAIAYNVSVEWYEQEGLKYDWSFTKVSLNSSE